MGKRGGNKAATGQPAACSHGLDEDLEWQLQPEAQPGDDCSGWPPGPSDLEGLFNWPEDHLRTIIAHKDRCSRLQAVVRRGIVNTTDYSGMDSPREVCFMLEHAMRAEFAWGGSVPRPLLRFIRSCDWAKVPQGVLVQMSTELDSRQSCVFPSLEARLPNEASALLDSMQPVLNAGSTGLPKKSTVDPDMIALAQSAYTEMATWLERNGQWVFNKDAVSDCLVHNKKCPATPPLPRDMPSALRVNWAGTTCTGWTAVGQQLRFADPSERCHAVWLAERQQKALDNTEDMFFQENVPKYPFKEKLREPLHDTHDIIRVVVGPEDLGWPSRRRRSLCCGLVRSKWKWSGPTSDQAIQTEFEQIFKRTGRLSGNSFLLAPSSEVRAWYSLKLAQRGIHVSGDKPLDIPSRLQDILPPGARLRLEAYKKILEESPEATDFIADVEHWPGCAVACGSMFPCQLTHGTVVSMKGDGGGGPRVFLGSEHLAALGWHIFDEVSGKFNSPMKKILRGLKGHTQKALAGNAMSLPAIAAFVLFIWSNIEQRHPQTEGDPGPEFDSSGKPGPDHGEHGGHDAADLERGHSKPSQATHACDAGLAGSSSSDKQAAAAGGQAELETQEYEDYEVNEDMEAVLKEGVCGSPGNPGLGCSESQDRFSKRRRKAIPASPDDCSDG